MPKIKLLTKEILKKTPKLYATEKVADPIVRAKFFAPWSYWTWYMIEYDPVEKRAFGWVVGHEKELGYFSLAELESLRGPMGLGIERDIWFRPKPLSKVKAEEGEYNPHPKVSIAKKKTDERKLDPPTRHQIRIARTTLRMPDAMVAVMGGMTKEEAKAVLKKYGAKPQKSKPRARRKKGKSQK